MFDNHSWNRIVSLNGSKILHSWEWIEAKRSVNQKSVLLFSDSDNLLCSIPIFIKQFKSFKYGWIPQGINFKGDYFKLKKELNLIKKNNFLLFIITEDFKDNSEDKMNKIYFKLSQIIKIGIKETLILKLLKNDDIISNYNKTTKKYVKKGLKLFNVIDVNKNDYVNIFNLYSQFAKIKKIKFPFDSNFYLNLLNICDNTSNKQNNLKQITKKIINKNNDTINFVTSLYFNNNALELLRYDSKDINNKFSSRLITHSVLETLRNSNVQNYDFGGVEKSNQGIRNFKLSFGGKSFKTNGYKLIV